MLQIGQITVNCVDSGRLAEFWTAALGYDEAGQAGDFTILADPAGTGPRLNLQRVPDAEPGASRAHLDLIADDRQAEVRRLAALGAREVGTIRAGTFTWTTMTDPAGNEFDVVGSSDA